MKPLIFDAHLDLSLNALQWNRDLRQPLSDIRGNEAGLTDLRGRGAGTVTLPEMREGNVGICVATQIGGCMKPAGAMFSWESPEQAWAATQGQLAWYQAMGQCGELRQIRNREMLDLHLAEWEEDPEHAPIGYILSLEGADSLVDLTYLERAWESGLRILGPAHFGVGRYAMGHDQDGPMSAGGKDLLREMDRLEMILDVTHLCEGSFWDALEIFEGPIWASHSNCRALVDNKRQLSDDQLTALVERGAIIGVACDAAMLVSGWGPEDSSLERSDAGLARWVDHVDHICQLAGGAKQVGIGSDLDGGFGRDRSPSDLDSIAGLQALPGLLRERGYDGEAVEGIMHGNFLCFVREAWTF